MEFEPINVVIIPDKFKGTLTATAAAEAIARGWREVRPGDRLELLPMSDGGDGFGEVLGHSCGAKELRCETMDAAHRPCQAKWWWDARSKTAVIESAAVIGLAMLPPNQFHPFNLDSQGLGLMLRAVARRKARLCLIGIGGSATNDGGFGLARALGWRFLDGAGNELEQWTRLPALEQIRPPQRPHRVEELVVAVDVQNPLLGRHGATQIYGPQKGLRPKELGFAEGCLRRLGKVVETELGNDWARVAGAGAAGGLGFGLLAFAGARLESGFALFARQARLERYLLAADLVITGEGTIDESTLMGKGVGQVARRCRQLRLHCIGLAGAIQLPATKRRAFSEMHALTELATLQQAKARPAFWLEQLAQVTARHLTPPKHTR